MAGVSVRDCVGEALRFVRERWRVIVIASALGALATAVFALIEAFVPPADPLVGVAATVMQAFVYAAFLMAALGAKDGAFDPGVALRMWAALVVVGFFLFIVLFVLMMPGAMVLVLGPMSPYLHDLQQAGQDQAAMMQVMSRFAETNPGALLAFLAFYTILWILLTSRLYLAAPATIDQKRILTFETWAWTRGQMLRIAGARIMLLAPAYVFVWCLTFLVGRSLGIDPMAAAPAGANPQFIAYAVFFSFVTFVAYSALEAGLSAAFYRVLKPADGAVSKT